ncbi:hypothetical protein C3F09_12320 [candidate division GN15 bacterium]|uniref:Uncharacterized protein n=1 Tax=candidate division GN15 bacterium TaxID=2072418 RepID=A0A855WZN0_9BACT|nr:MAG: hypothetical protein C3F09_12320 [candidate division GN15 bacterium]
MLNSRWAAYVTRYTEEILSWSRPVKTLSLSAGLLLRIMATVVMPAGSVVFAQSDPPASSNQAPPLWASAGIEALDSGLYRIGTVLIDRKNSAVSIPGAVNMREGAIEYLAVTPDGKTYESVLTLKTKPLHLQLALLLLGAEFGGGLAYQGDSALPAGDSVDMYVAWLDEQGKTVTHPATDLLYDREARRAMPKSKWIFTGSVIRDSASFAADVEGSIIAVYSDPVAILNNPRSGRFDQTTYNPNTDLLPALGTEITMTIVVPKR